MNVGTEQIKHKILRALKRSNAHLKQTRYGEFADDLAEEIYELLGEPDMSKKDWDLYHQFPPELLPIVKKLERALGGFTFKRDEQAQEVYRWVAEQPEKDLRRFIAWAIAPERIAFVAKYRNNPATIRFDWENEMLKEQAVTLNADGSYNV